MVEKTSWEQLSTQGMEYLRSSRNNLKSEGSVAQLLATM